MHTLPRRHQTLTGNGGGRAGYRSQLLAGLLALALLLLGGALPAPSAAWPDGEEATPDRPLLWSVRDDQGRDLWLLGSIHLANASIYPLPKIVEQAFAASEVVAVEVDVVRADSSELQARMMRAAFDPEGRTLSARLPKELYRKTADHFAALGLELALFETMRPSFVAMTLGALALQGVGLDPEHGIEHHFLRRAGERPVVELETLEDQVELLASLDDELEILFLRHTLMEMSDLGAQAKRLLAAWRQGDQEALEALRSGLASEVPELAPIDTLMFTRRNHEMAEKIAAFVASGRRHFVIVGAGHLVGDDGIPALLAARGLQVERAEGLPVSPAPQVPEVPAPASAEPTVSPPS